MSAPAGFKDDADKPRVGLMVSDFARSLDAVARVTTMGAAKYTEGGWVKVPGGVARYTDAMLRHLLAERVDEFDAESGLLHAAHVAWNALARLDLLLRAGTPVRRSPAGPTPGEDARDNAAALLRLTARATHRCKTCGALWRLNPAEDARVPASWTLLLGQTACDRCDNAPMGCNVESIE